MDFSYLDVLLDAVFIFRSDKSCIYCNEAAAHLCNSSVKRLTKGRPLYDFILFEDSNLFAMPEGTLGSGDTFPLTELKYHLVQNKEKNGRVQVSISPFKNSKEDLWIMLIRDVTVEQVLHEKYKKQLDQLEAYSKNLEKMVEERTRDLKMANSMLNAVMNSLGQGFLVFNENGMCLDIYTKACESILEDVPVGKDISTILYKNESSNDQFEMWIKAVFSESLPFESLKELAPQFYTHSKGYFVTLDFFALRDDEGKITSLVLVATDKTAEKKVEQALDKEKDKAKMIVELISHQKIFSTFMARIPKHIDYLTRQVGSDLVSLDEIFRVLHTIEGEAGMFHITEIKNAAKRVQDVISVSRKEKRRSLESCREDYILSIKDFVKVFEDFKIENHTLLETLNINEDTNIIQMDRNKVMDFYQALTHPALRERFLNDFCKVKVKTEVNLANSVLNQVAEKQGKKINSVTILGGDIKVNPDRTSGLFSSFVHIYRNIADHGIESPEERLDFGKTESGNVTIEFVELKDQASSTLQIRVEDDGRGIDPEMIRSKLRRKGPQGNWDNLDDHSIIQEIFNPGFSSKESSGEFSGRGVGMDAVKTEVLKLGGEIEVFSQLGKGTTIIIKVPMRESAEFDKSA